MVTTRGIQMPTTFLRTAHQSLANGARRTSRAVAMAALGASLIVTTPNMAFS